MVARVGLDASSILAIWQGVKESDLQRAFWRRSCYHYTNPLCQGTKHFGIGNRTQNFIFQE